MKPYQWKKGQSGNPNGRPKNESCLTALLRKKLKMIAPKEYQQGQKDKRKYKTYEELIVIATMQLAMDGNSRALGEVWERLEGKVPQPIGLDMMMQTKECVGALQSILTMPVTIEGVAELKMIEQIVKMQNNKKKGNNAKGKTRKN